MIRVIYSFRQSQCNTYYFCMSSSRLLSVFVEPQPWQREEFSRFWRIRKGRPMSQKVLRNVWTIMSMGYVIDLFACNWERVSRGRREPVTSSRSNSSGSPVSDPQVPPKIVHDSYVSDLAANFTWWRTPSAKSTWPWHLHPSPGIFPKLNFLQLKIALWSPPGRVRCLNPSLHSSTNPRELDWQLQVQRPASHAWKTSKYCAKTIIH